MFPTRLVIDLSNVIWTALRAGKDKENGITVEHKGRQVLVNSAGYGRENAINMIVKAWKQHNISPMNTIVVYEGRGTKALRIAMYAGYKGGADAEPSQPPESYEQFNLLKEMLLAELRALGAHACTQDGVEGDDIIAYLCENLQGKVVVLSTDGDLTILTNDRVKVLPAGEITDNPFGPFPTQYITLYKALVGDDSDKIKGAKLFGDKAWLDLYCIFGDEGLEMLDNLVRTRQIPRLAEDVAELKTLQRIIDSEKAVYESYAAASLYPEFVNTLRRPLQWTAGANVSRTTDERLRPYAARRGRVVDVGNYDEAMKFLRENLILSPFVAFDIETATGDESDEWLMRVKGLEADDDLGVDVFGSELVGMGITFGPNMQYSFYFDHQHEGNRNLTIEQMLAVAQMIHRAKKRLVVHNASFELPVCFNAWGHLDTDNGFHGFLPNVLDTMVMASEVDENESKGLKELSKRLFDYDQVTYDEVTGGKKMHLLTAEQVVAYGCDDTIMTAGLFNFFGIIMEIEKTWNAYLQAEVGAAYVNAKAFVDGIPFDMERMKEMQAEDKATHGEAWARVRDYLISIGFEGSVCPTFTVEDLTVPAKIKEIVQLCLGEELKTQVRTPEKLVKLVAQIGAGEDGTGRGAVLASLLQDGLAQPINEWAARNFSGEPVMDFDSPKVMRSLLYDTLGLPVRLVNSVTDKERTDNKPLADAVYKHKRIFAGTSDDIEITPEEQVLLRKKAKTDAKAVGFALMYEDGTPEVRALLGDIQTIKTMETREKLFYAKYKHLQHWKDGKLHPSVRQVGTVTRRPSVSGPNTNQLPKKGEGVKFRETYLPHKKGAVVGSIDFNSQELRIQADKCRDPNFLSCYIGDNKRNLHIITAAGALRRRWGADVVEQAFGAYDIGTDIADREYALMAAMRKGGPFEKKADDHYKGAKNVNFAAGYDAEAPKLSETLIIPIEDARDFLATKKAMFPGFEQWKADVKARLQKQGYVTTYLGARRHLAAGVLNPNKWEVEGALRQGPNYEIQGAAAEQTKLAQTAIWNNDTLFKYDMVFYANIYDELVFSVTAEDAVAAIREIHGFMTQKYMDVVPEVGSISLGPNFGQQIECGDEFDENAVQAALAKAVEQERLAA